MIRCLLIEDNGFDRKLLRQAAEDCSLDFAIDEAADIRSADARLAEASFDCIMLDFRLPDGDGLSFARRFLGGDEARTALIMFTAEGNEELAREALQQGILDYLPKANLSPQSLERSVSNALTKIRLLRERKQALAELQRSNQALSRFAATVAHDLKAPIRQMQTFSSFLFEDHRAELSEDGQQILETIERAAGRAFKLIDGMLAYATLDKKGEEHAALSLKSALDDALANLQALIEEAGAMIEIGDLPDVIGVDSQLMQLFQNLINNALKFRHPERKPVIRIDARRTDAKTVEIAVADNGIGIAPDYRERIFDMLERLHSQDRYEGAGIGLATCRRIVENHDGRIWCESEEGEGTAFVFTLRRAKDHPEMTDCESETAAQAMTG